MPTQPDAVLITGLYGAGKSSLVEELAELLEAMDAPYGAIDVDWLRWFHLRGQRETEGSPEIWTQNLSDVAGRYVGAGVEYLLLAQAARDNDDVQRMRDALPCSLRVVRLDTDVAVIEERLRNSPTTGRANDLAAAQEWSRRGWGQVDADLVLDGDMPLQDLAATALEWLGWARHTK
jgi:hypothetical protein